ncbi:MAG: ABC transporter ATP-binding protein [Geminicoccaceae bacterium]
MLAVRDLHVAYGNVVALRGVSLEVGKGEIVAVIGPNGAGKSTLLQTIAGVVAPRRGDVSLDGRSILGTTPEQRVAQGISLVPEGRRIFSSLTVAENLRIGATVRKDATEVAADIERFFGLFPILRERAGQKAGKLSGGEQQMLAIARAMLARPQLLMIDEPSLGLAPLVVHQVFEAIRSLRQSGTTVLLVEQSIKRALGIADRTYVLGSGEVRMSGTSADLAGTAAFEEAYFGPAQTVAVGA